jgi:hypothetical protein
MVGWFLVTVAVSAYVQTLVPMWVGVPLRYSFFVMFLAGLVILVRRWWPDESPGTRPPRRADPAESLPLPGSARRMVVGNLVLAVLAVAITIGFTAVTLVWAHGGLPMRPGDGPAWYNAVVFIGGSIGMGTLSTGAVYQACRLLWMVPRVESGREPRWLVTVLRQERGTWIGRATSVNPPGLRDRTIRINPLPGFADLRPGDVVVLDGLLRRGEPVAVTGVHPPCWVNLTWRQPRELHRLGRAGRRRVREIP